MAERILIVDNHLANLKLEKIALSTKGYEIELSVNAHEAMHLLETFRPRLILMEIQLPGLNGLELTRKLKNDPKYQHIIIVAVTACCMVGDERMAFEAGYDGYITKPIDVDTFPELIADFLNKEGY